MLGLLAIVTLFLGVQAQYELHNITSLGYPAEWHNVTTSDGYILGVVRIPHGKNSKKSNGKVVFLMHGLEGGYNSFTYLGSDYGMAYNLADAGYDVWLGNARGNKYSRRHVSLDPDEETAKFYDFTLEEIGLYDLPAMIDYALATTKQDKLHYIGHSQGGTTFMILNSMNAEYQSKFASAHLMAGVGYSKEIPNKWAKLVSTVIDEVYALALLVGFVEVKLSPLTILALDAFANATVPPEFVAGSGLKQGVHFFQNFRDKTFRRWNYGATNLLKYGSISPPSYDITKINVDVTLHYSLGDAIQSETDALDMVKVMPNARARKVARSDFTHMDYVTSKDMKEITDFIIESFNNL